jgi:hypothetical protein
VAKNINVFYDMTSCSLVDVYRRFGVTYWLNHRYGTPILVKAVTEEDCCVLGRDAAPNTEDRGRTFIRNVSEHV